MPIAAVLRPSISTLLYKIPHCTTRTARTMTSLIALKKGSPEPPAPKPGQLRLYGHRFCPYVHRVRLVLAAKKIPHETLNIHVPNKPEWLVNKSPFNLIPIIEQDGNILYESTIVSEYLDEKFPSSVKLLSDDPFRKAKGRILAEHASKALVTLVTSSKSSNNPSFEALFNGLQYFEDHLANGGTKYFHGENPGMTDYMVWPTFEWILTIPYLFERDSKSDLDKYPHLASYIEAMQQDPVVKQCRNEIPLMAEYFKGYISNNANPDVGSPEPSPPRPGQTRLYGHRFCPFVYRVRLVLAAKNLEYEIVNVDLKEKPEWLPLKNAASKVPILEKDGNILVESVIISDYLDEAYPSVKLHPDDPLEKAKGRIISENSVNIISQMGKVLKSTAGPVFDDLFQEIANYEKELEKRGTLYFNGKSPGMTDYMIWPSFELVLALPVVYDNANFTLEKFPLIFKWAENMQAHPAVQQTTVGIPLCAQYYSAYREGTQDANVGL